MQVTPDLASALLVLVVLLIATVGLCNVWLIPHVLSGQKPLRHKVELTSKAEDNIFTKSAAAEHTKAAEANERAAKLALETARVQQRTEEARLERARLEKSD